MPELHESARPRNITRFYGEHRWLSNFWPCQVSLEGIEFQHVEGAYVAAKTHDIDTRRRIAAVTNPGEVKRLGRTLTALRSDWDQVKLGVMGDLLRQKFEPGSALARKLLATGDCLLIEGNTWGDTFWGICDGEGQNQLGKLLMQIRSELTLTN